MKMLLCIFASFIISTNLFSQELITQENINEVVSSWIEDSVSTEIAYGHISDWDVSNVNDMSQVFLGATNFNSDLSSWNVSNVTNMSYMFYSAAGFNGDLSSWNVSNVTDMSYMFSYTTSFNGDLLSWDVSSVTDMSYVFGYATSFNGDLSSWDVSNVTNMTAMFASTTSLSEENQCAIQESFSTNLNWPYEWDCPVSCSDGYSANPSYVENDGCTNGNYSGTFTHGYVPEGYYGYEGVSYIYCGSGGCYLKCEDPCNEISLLLITQENIHQVVDDWVLDSVSTEAIYGNISSWDVSSVTDMGALFQYAASFNGDISSWDVSNVTNMYIMFNSAGSFNGDLSSWDVSNVTQMSSMFNSASNFNGDLSSWDVSTVTYMEGMFNNTQSLSEENKCAIQTSFSTNLNWPYEWECPVTQITQENIYGAVDAWLSDSVSTEDIYGHISDWDVSNVTNMSYMFYDANSFNGDISSWNVSNVINMASMFRDATFNGDISSWDVSSVTDMNWMFYLATNFNGDLSSWDVSNVTNMHNMFYLATNFNGDLSSWDVSNVTDMANMFRGISSFNVDLSSWDVSSVLDFYAMFTNIPSLSEENKCAIQTSFSTNPNWPYQWECANAAVYGCTDENALNYAIEANTDDGSCVAIVNGCTDETALNYAIEANTDDGSCIAIVNGCTDETALNYAIEANTDDGACVYSQGVNLSGSWNSFSTYIAPEITDIIQVFASLESNLLIVKNNYGDAYLPQWNLNGIGDMVIGQGYQMKLIEPSILTVNGSIIQPELYPIELIQGWNLIAYLRINPADAVDVLEEIVQDGNLVIAKDNQGNIYLPELNFNGIGNFSAGNAYQIKVISSQSLNYLSNQEDY